MTHSDQDREGRQPGYPSAYPGHAGRMEPPHGGYRDSHRNPVPNWGPQQPPAPVHPGPADHRQGYPDEVESAAGPDGYDDGAPGDDLHDLLGELHGRFDRLEHMLKTDSGVVERNYEQSLIALRDRAIAAESGITQHFLRPLTKKVAAVVNRTVLEIAKKQADPWVLADSVIDELLELLEDFGVDTIDCQPGDPVDRARHHVVKSVRSRGAQDDAHVVVERVQYGFEMAGHVLRPAEITADWVPVDSGPVDSGPDGESSES